VPSCRQSPNYRRYPSRRRCPVAPPVDVAPPGRSHHRCSSHRRWLGSPAAGRAAASSLSSGRALARLCLTCRPSPKRHPLLAMPPPPPMPPVPKTPPDEAPPDPPPGVLRTPQVVSWGLVASAEAAALPVWVAASGTGGTSGTGGQSSTGGQTGSGGAAGSGGAKPSGGATSSGGATGPVVRRPPAARRAPAARRVPAVVRGLAAGPAPAVLAAKVVPRGSGGVAGTGGTRERAARRAPAGTTAGARMPAHAGGTSYPAPTSPARPSSFPSLRQQQRHLEGPGLVSGNSRLLFSDVTLTTPSTLRRCSSSRHQDGRHLPGGTRGPTAMAADGSGVLSALLDKGQRLVSSTTRVTTLAPVVSSYRRQKFNSPNGHRDPLGWHQSKLHRPSPRLPARQPNSETGKKGI